MKWSSWKIRHFKNDVSKNYRHGLISYCENFTSYITTKETFDKINTIDGSEIICQYTSSALLATYDAVIDSIEKWNKDINKVIPKIIKWEQTSHAKIDNVRKQLNTLPQKDQKLLMKLIQKF